MTDKIGSTEYKPPKSEFFDEVFEMLDKEQIKNGVAHITPKEASTMTHEEIMKKIKEQVTITVDEHPSEGSEHIVDVVVELNTLQGNEASATTELINGILKCVIILSNKSTEVHIRLHEYPEIELYRNMQFIGSAYLPLRQSAIASDASQFNFAPQVWALNNQIDVHIRGQKETNTLIIFRYVK